MKVDTTSIVHTIDSVVNPALESEGLSWREFAAGKIDLRHIRAMQQLVETGSVLTDFEMIVAYKPICMSRLRLIKSKMRIS